MVLLVSILEGKQMGKWTEQLICKPCLNYGLLVDPNKTYSIGFMIDNIAGTHTVFCIHCNRKIIRKLRKGDFTNGQ